MPKITGFLISIEKKEIPYAERKVEFEVWKEPVIESGFFKFVYHDGSISFWNMSEIDTIFISPIKEGENNG